MKRYLLIMGSNYYPSAYTDDWIDFFDSENEALECIKNFDLHSYKHVFVCEGHPKDGCRADWYDIVDLYTWKP